MWRRHRLRRLWSGSATRRDRAICGSKASGTGAGDTAGFPATGRARRVRMRFGCRAMVITIMAAITIAAAIGASAGLMNGSGALLRGRTVRAAKLRELRFGRLHAARNQFQEPVKEVHAEFRAFPANGGDFRSVPASCGGRLP